MKKLLSALKNNNHEDNMTENKKVITKKTADIIGYEKEKGEMDSLGNMLLGAGKYHEKGLRIPRGLLLIGEPGTGKTTMARSIAKDGLNLVELHTANVVGNQLPEYLHGAFQFARQSAPSVLLLDELDKIIEGNSQPMGYDINTLLLNELDSLGDMDDVLVVATCNSKEEISHALLRPGRFDRQLTISMPDEKTRYEILEYYFSKLKLTMDTDLHYVAKLIYGYSCAGIQSLANEVGIRVVEKDEDIITLETIRKVINKTAFKGEASEELMDELEKKHTAEHEAGHAIAALYLMPDSLHGASILPQGESLGHINLVCEDEGKCPTIYEMENLATVILAGRAGEQYARGELTLGSSDDLKKAAVLVQKLIFDGVAYGYFAAYNMCSPCPSEDVSGRAARIFEEKLQEFEERAAEIIKEHADLYHALVKELTTKTVLSRDELLSLKAEQDEKDNFSEKIA